MTRRLLPFVFGCAFAATFHADKAAACTGLECHPDQFVPRSGAVPANLPGIAWWSGDAYIRDADADGGGSGLVRTQPSDLRFQCKAPDGASRSVTFEAEPASQGLAFLRPNTPLQAGERCTIESTTVDCNLQDANFLLSRPDFNRSYLSGRADFQVTEPAPLPTTLGRVSVQPPFIERLELSEGAGCSAVEDVCAVRVRLSWSDDAELWDSSFVLSTEVDGKPWTIWRSAIVPLERGGSYLGRGYDVVFARLPNMPKRADVAGLSSGRHSVVIRATLPGTEIALATDPVEFDLNCAQPAADGGMLPKPTDAGPREPDASDASEPDAGKPSTNGGARAPRTQHRNESSGCAVTDAPQAGAWPALATFLAVIGVWYRRRSQRSIRS